MITGWPSVGKASIGRLLLLPEQKEAPSIVASVSKEYRGGFFTYALLAEFAEDFKTRSPYPGLVDETGQRAEQKEQDFGPTKTTHPSPCLPKRSLQAIPNSGCSASVVHHHYLRLSHDVALSLASLCCFITFVASRSE
jgi:hypothetical protein